MDRLNRAHRERDFVDRAIDLGIALEALLLHGKNDNTEITFRLSLRGALLVGRTEKERLDTYKLLTRAYRLRSTAVHSGHFNVSTENQRTMSQTMNLCRRLILAAIDANGTLDWDHLMFACADDQGARTSEWNPRLLLRRFCPWL